MDTNHYHTVRVVCNACGWFRVIGYTGVKVEVRALVRLRRSKSPANVLECDIRKVPAALPRADYPPGLDGFEDLDAEAHEHGLFAVCGRFKPLLDSFVCPRCKKASALNIDMYLTLGGDPHQWRQGA